MEGQQYKCQKIRSLLNMRALEIIVPANNYSSRQYPASIPRDRQVIGSVKGGAGSAVRQTLWPTLLRQRGAFAYLGSVVLITRDVFGGAIRYYLDQLHIPLAWFGFDVVVGIFVLITTALALLGRQDGYARILALIFIAAFASLMGALNGFPPNSIGSAWKIYLPIFLFLSRMDGDGLPAWVRRALWILLISNTLFVFASTQTDFPWKDYAFTVLNERRANVTWWISTSVRAAGAAEAHFTAAAAALTCGLLLCLNGRGRRWIGLAALGLAVTVGIWTTSRAASVAASGAIIAIGIQSIIGRLGVREQLFSRLLVILPLGIGLYVPLLISLYQPIGNNRENSALFSIVDRAAVVWPQSVSRLTSSPLSSQILGMGFGSVGSPSRFAGLSGLDYTCDNLGIYWVILLGFPIFALLSMWWLRQLMLISDKFLPILFGFGLFTITSNGEQASALVLLSVLLGARGQREPARRR